MNKTVDDWFDYYYDDATVEVMVDDPKSNMQLVRLKPGEMWQSVYIQFHSYHIVCYGDIEPIGFHCTWNTYQMMKGLESGHVMNSGYFLGKLECTRRWMEELDHDERNEEISSLVQGFKEATYEDVENPTEEEADEAWEFEIDVRDIYKHLDLNRLDRVDEFLDKWGYDYDSINIETIEARPRQAAAFIQIAYTKLVKEKQNESKHTL